MWDQVTAYFLRQPERLRSLGRAICSTGCWIALFAAIGRVAVMTNALAPLCRRASEPMSLSILYPSLPTFWIPETPFAAMCTLAIILLGSWINSVGAKYERVLRWI